MTKVTMRSGPRAAAAPRAEPVEADLVPGAAADDPKPDAGAELSRFIAGIPNFGVKDVGGGKKGGPQMNVTFGSPVQVATIRVIDVADEWDLAEMAGEAGKNEQWLMMARAALAVLAIDSTSWIPGRGGYTRGHLREVMRALGIVGVNAIAAAQAGMRPDSVGAGAEAVAKN